MCANPRDAHGVVRQEPLADALKLLAPPTWVEVRPAQQITERRHDKETRSCLLKGDAIGATGSRFYRGAAHAPGGGGGGGGLRGDVSIWSAGTRDRAGVTSRPCLQS